MSVSRDSDRSLDRVEPTVRADAIASVKFERRDALTMARAAYDLAVVQWPLKLVKLCQGGRILRRSDRAKE